MKVMPKEIKQKLRQLSEACIKARTLEQEVYSMIEKFDVDPDRLNGVSPNSPRTESLAFISNSECRDHENLKEAISEIEEVFLHIVNKENN